MIIGGLLQTKYHCGVVASEHPRNDNMKHSGYKNHIVVAMGSPGICEEQIIERTPNVSEGVDEML